MAFFNIISKGVMGDFKNGYYIDTFSKLDNGEIILTGSFEVLPKTVGQYTGKYDIKRKYIFENDICSFEYFATKYIGLVRYNTNVCCFELYKKYSDGHIKSVFINQCNNAKVIGNIFGNSELLEASEC